MTITETEIDAMNPPQDYRPSVFAKQFAKHELQWLMEQHMTMAQQAHQDARAWMNRALLAEARLATLRAEYEPQGMEPPC